ncbi:nitroreductase family deazaflavin-dependent oxidoreductase [Streptomyces bauhiniae]
MQTWLGQDFPGGPFIEERPKGDRPHERRRCPKGGSFRRRLLLHHIGRSSGLDRRAVLDVMECDPEAGTWVVASWSGADWYRNLRARPQAVIEVGSRHYAVTAYFLTPAERTEGGRPSAGGAACLVRLDTDGGHRRR